MILCPGNRSLMNGISLSPRIWSPIPPSRRTAIVLSMFILYGYLSNDTPHIANNAFVLNETELYGRDPGKKVFAEPHKA
jgi:hypothetical protein